MKYESTNPIIAPINLTFYDSLYMMLRNCVYVCCICISM